MEVRIVMLCICVVLRVYVVSQKKLICLYSETALPHMGKQLGNIYFCCERSCEALLEEKVLYRTLKGSISATYLEPPKGSIHS